jgi:hypothetical protein
VHSTRSTQINTDRPSIIVLPSLKLGFFAGSRAKAERADAERAADAIAPSLERIGAAEARAAQTDLSHECGSAAPGRCHAHPEAQRAGAVATLAAAPDQKTRAELWRGITEVDRRRAAAVLGRCGSSGSATTPYAPCCAAEARRLRRLPCRASTKPHSPLSALREGEYANARQSEAARLVQRQALGYRRGPPTRWRCLSRGDRVRVGRWRWGLRPAASGRLPGARCFGLGPRRRPHPAIKAECCRFGRTIDAIDLAAIRIPSNSA